MDDASPVDREPAPVEAGWSEPVLSWPEGHDHADPAHHAGLTTPNFEIVGYDPLVSAHYGHTPAGYLCGDATATTDGRRLAVVESRSDVGFAIADVTDPAAPRWLGELLMPSTYVYDVAVVPDGKHVVLVTSEAQPEGLVPDLPPVPWRATWRSPCAAAPVVLAQPDPVPRPASVVLIDITDPAAPAVIDQRPMAGLGHSVFSTILDGRTWVLASAVSAPATDTFYFYELLDTPLGAKLDLLSAYVPPAAQDQVAADVGGHDDGVIATHPITGDTLAYLVNRRDLVVLDLADPRRPAEVGRWSDWTPERMGFAANLHSVYPLPAPIDGRHYTVVGPEWTGKPEGHPSGIVFVLDTTDPSAPRAVAGWTLPHDVEWSDYLHFSTHYLSVVDRTLFVSMYHAGVWAVDLGAITGDAFVSLPSVGVFMPVNVSPAPPDAPIRWTPTLEEVLALPGGDLVTFDSNSGLYVFRFDATRPAPPPEPWPLDAPPT